ncbi:MAG: hypothetical protein KGJ98_07210 [Chloroflexota bacterium]|nr:hypothetical protein [Chloroflexota bacterium]
MPVLAAIFASVTLVSGALTPLFARLARRIGLVVAPRTDRWHARPTPLLGGASMVLAALLASVVVLPFSTKIGVLVLCAAAAFALGLLDDFRHLAPTTKLVGQTLIASMLVAGGTKVELISFAPVAYLLSVLWVVGIMNAVNLMDNMDGLAAGICLIGALVLAVSAWPMDGIAVTLAVITAAAAAGFLVHNFYPARVFMGDAGSQFLGFMLASIALAHTGRTATSVGLAILAPLAALALPIFDTTLVTTARRLAGVPVSRGGRDHTSHRLAALGLSDRSAVLVLYAVAAGFGLLALSTEIIAGIAIPLFVLAVVSLVLFGIFLVEIAGRGPEAGVPKGDGRRFGRVFATYGRFGAEIAMDVALLTTVYYLSYLVRFEGQAEDLWLYLFAGSVPFVVGIQLGAMVLFGVYRTLWRYLSVRDAAGIVRAVSLGSAVAFVFLLVTPGFIGFSRAASILDWLLACAVIVGSRTFVLWLIEVFSARPGPSAHRVVIAGANDAGVMALRFLGRASGTDYHVVGFIDDDPGKRFRSVAGVPVLGTTRDLPSVVERFHPDLVLSTAESAVPVRLTCEELGVAWREFSVEV